MIVLYAEPLPADLQEIVRGELPAGWTLDVLPTRHRGDLFRRLAGVDFVIAATAYPG